MKYRCVVPVEVSDVIKRELLSGDRMTHVFSLLCDNIIIHYLFKNSKHFKIVPHHN